MSKVKIFYGDNSEVRKNKTDELFERFMPKRGESHDIVIIVPGRRPDVLVGTENNAAEVLKRTYVSKFTQSALLTLFEDNFADVNCVIIEDAHRLSVGSAENIIKFSNKWAIDLYMLGRKTNEHGGKYAVLDYLADNHYEMEELDDIRMQLPPVVRASEMPEKKQSDKTKGVHEIAKIPPETELERTRKYPDPKKRRPSKRATKADIAQMITIATENRAVLLAEKKNVEMMVNVTLNNIDKSSELIGIRKDTLVGFIERERDVNRLIEKSTKIIGALQVQEVQRKR